MIALTQQPAGVLAAVKDKPRRGGPEAGRP